MKPRLPVARLTNEDADIFDNSTAYWPDYHAADRRDAELMLIAARCELGYVVRSTDPKAANFVVWVRAPRGARTMWARLGIT